MKHKQWKDTGAATVQESDDFKDVRRRSLNISGSVTNNGNAK